MNPMLYLTEVVTLELDQTRCNGCKMCLAVCPHAVFGFREKKAVIQHKDLCMECGACAMNCPQDAISVRSGVGCAAGIIKGILRGTEPSCDCSGSDSSCC